MSFQKLAEVWVGWAAGLVVDAPSNAHTLHGGRYYTEPVCLKNNALLPPASLCRPLMRRSMPIHGFTPSVPTLQREVVGPMQCGSENLGLARES